MTRMQKLLEKKGRMRCCYSALFAGVTCFAACGIAACGIDVACPEGTTLDKQTQICVGNERAPGAADGGVSEGPTTPSTHAGDAGSAASDSGAAVSPALRPDASVVAAMPDSGATSPGEEITPQPAANPGSNVDQAPPSEGSASRSKPDSTPNNQTPAQPPTSDATCVPDGDRDICDGKDNNCDGRVDEGWSITVPVVTGSSGPWGQGATLPTINRWTESPCLQPCVGSYSVRGKFVCDLALKQMACGALQSGCVPIATPYAEDDPPGLVATYPVRD